ncbi:NF-X1 type zinc finger [Apiospora hydei]|uniref:NF-X1 type zinc finger n=1 Tax=Apiospora hydei TaxID=1337664 RepID=A0ABR1X2W8_9PEZI
MFADHGHHLQVWQNNYSHCEKKAVERVAARRKRKNVAASNDEVEAEHPCLKVKKSCDHADNDPCHAPYPCKEDKPCQAKTFITCECQHRKQEVRCLASKTNPFPDRPPLKCDDECLRLQRNAKLAAALNIDPETHKDNHVPYSDKTLDLFKEGIRFAQTQEREFRVFASDPQEKRLRFKPMKPQQRAFLHALAEDYGLDSESQDPEPHRHVSIFKTPRFVSAPAKTLAQCVQIKTSGLTEDSTAPGPVTNPLMNVPYNALLLTAPRFGLTVEDVESVLTKDLATQPTVTYTTGFLPNDEIVIKGSGSWAAQALEASVTALKPLISQTIVRSDIAKAVFLCHADTSLNVVRREVDPVKNADGWSSVVGRSSAKQARSATASAGEAKPAAGRKLLMLKKEPKKKLEVEPVEDDWEAAAERIDDQAED